MARAKSKNPGPCFFGKVLRGFLEEMEEEKKHRKNGRKRRGNCFFDMNDLYGGFGNRYDDDDDDEEDLEDDEDDEDDDEDDEDDDEDDEDDDEDEDDDADDPGRGCGLAGGNADGGKSPMELLSGLGRYFNASDYDKDYEE
jgi:hypothetical protein